MFEQVSETAGRSWKLWLVLAVLAFGLFASLIWVLRITRMPLKSYSGQLPHLTNEQRETVSHLSQSVKYLSETIGERNLSKAETLQAGTDYIQSQLKQAGYAVTAQAYLVQGRQVQNLEVRLPGTDAASEAVVVGAHYDSVTGAPGADDNATGVAGVLELARLLQGSAHRKTIRLVLFVNEEPPFFQTESMGSLVYARRLRAEHVSVSVMISLEMLGFYSDIPGSQKYPVLLGFFLSGSWQLHCLRRESRIAQPAASIRAQISRRLNSHRKASPPRQTGPALAGQTTGLSGRNSIPPS
jgi:hypothetical protein